MRGSLIEAMDEDYIRTARAKGLPERSVVRQGVRSSINPIVTLLGLEIGDAARRRAARRNGLQHPRRRAARLRRDHPGRLPVIQGTVLLAAMFIIVANIVVDIAYAYLDPRVRYS